MLFFTNDGDLKSENSRSAAPFRPQRDLSVMVSRVDAPGQRSIEKNLTQCNFLGGNQSCQCLPSREKRERLELLSLTRARNILVAKTEFVTPKNYFFFSKD